MGASHVPSSLARHALVAAVIALAGCASPATEGWTRAGTSEEQRGRDTMDCLTEARETVLSRDGPRPKVNYDRYRRCMEDRGYASAASR